MKLWIIALAISTLGGCGDERSTEQQSSPPAAQNVQPAPPQELQTPASPFAGDTSGIVVDSSAARPGMHPDPNAPKPGHVEKPKPRPKPVVIDIMK